MHGKDKQWVVSKVLYSLSVWGWSEIVVVSVFFTAAGKSLSVRTEPLAVEACGRTTKVSFRGDKVERYHFPGMGTPHSYQPTNGWDVRLPITPNVTGSCLYARKYPAVKNKTNENIIHRHLWKCLMLESYKRVPGLFIITAQHRFVDSRAWVYNHASIFKKPITSPPMKACHGLLLPSSIKLIKLKVTSSFLEVSA